MEYDVLVKEAKTLPQDILKEVLDYMHYLVAKRNKEEASGTREKHFKRQLGIWQGETFYMAEDFDATPECHKDTPNCPGSFGKYEEPATYS